MLGKRSRPVQKTGSNLHLMPDCPSDSSPTRDHPEDKNKSLSFFNTPRLFIGFNPKGFTESDGVRSPTSPLDIKTLSGVGITFWQEKQLRSPRSGLEGLQSGSSRHWEKRDSEGVGLGIVAALHKSSSSNDSNGAISPKASDTRKPLLGSQLKILVGSNQTQLSSPHTQLSSPRTQLMSAHAHLSCPQKQLSSSSNPLKGSQILLSPPRTHLNSPQACCSSVHADMKFPQTQLISSHKQSEPIPIGSPHGFAKSPPKNAMEHSESYTCVTSYGPESSTKHIYAYCNMKNETVQIPVRKCEQEIGNVASPPCADAPVFPTADFLSACYLCKRRLSHGKDIYMYRGDKAFCSVECRYQQILMDERMEKYASSPPSSTPPTSTCCGRIFSTSTAAAA